MIKMIDLSGVWQLQLDKNKEGYKLPFQDTITLPNSTSNAKKGEQNEAIEIGCLTDEYKFEGYAWFRKEVTFDSAYRGNNVFLFLERTRVTTLFIDDKKVGTQNSLCAPHVYDVSDYVTEGKHTITVLVDNTSYPTKGGHLTSPDTQTNWNGITGRIELQVFDKAYLTNVQVYPNITDKSIAVTADVHGADHGRITIWAVNFQESTSYISEKMFFEFKGNKIELIYPLGENALLWDEYEPNLYQLYLALGNDTIETIFGLREFKTDQLHFTINGTSTFLRGKHDGMIFPLTGFAPTSVEEWHRIMAISKSYGINHYRFHTCCPPEAAFIAADLLGIYMEPELPFWGTVTDESHENHNQAEQDYLIREGFHMLEKFGNHPSFIMMSMGNELWGSKPRLAQFLRDYKAFDNRHLYTQGSNNFQFYPEILTEDDFFCGVRFSKERLIRGSYAMCDAPLGHLQAAPPSTNKNYDGFICPTVPSGFSMERAEGTIQIQYGTEVKTVNAADSNDSYTPQIPVVSHEIGQYATFPNFKETKKYTGALKAHNFEVFEKRLKEKGMLDLADQFFQCSGKLAVACYKEELESALRSEKMGGFQILDLQDFSGQGTALVGILDAFMDSKGLVSAEEWRSFCSDKVILAEFDKYVYSTGEQLTARILLVNYSTENLSQKQICCKLCDGNTVIESSEMQIPSRHTSNYLSENIVFQIPQVTAPTKLTLTLSVEGTDISNQYYLWLYPKADTFLYKLNLQADSPAKSNIIKADGQELYVVNTNEEAEKLLCGGKRVLLLPMEVKESIQGFYCTDFWCYPMFRSISESMGKPIPVGTMGLLIQKEHLALKEFPTEEYSTPQWYEIVSHADCTILDETPATFRPIVQMIDNFERNHKLGILYEANVFSGKLLVCTSRLSEIFAKPEVRQFAKSIINYALSDEFKPQSTLDANCLFRK